MHCIYIEVFWYGVVSDVLKDIGLVWINVFVYGSFSIKISFMDVWLWKSLYYKLVGVYEIVKLISTFIQFFVLFKRLLNIVRFCKIFLFAQVLIALFIQTSSHSLAVASFIMLVACCYWVLWGLSKLLRLCLFLEYAAGVNEVQYTSGDVSKLVTYSPTVNGVELQSFVPYVFPNGFHAKKNIAAKVWFDNFVKIYLQVIFQ